MGDVAVTPIVQSVDTSELVLREGVARDEARAEIAAYVREHPGSFPFDVAIALRLSPDLVGEVVEELIADGTIERESTTP
ncbi:MAG: hypothetical protein FJX75_17605 [Armatimonadetes bacterium]|nr:hypothetical protein [Armatimonadota bacterium]